MYKYIFKYTSSLQGDEHYITVMCVDLLETDADARAAGALVVAELFAPQYVKELTLVQYEEDF